MRLSIITVSKPSESGFETERRKKRSGADIARRVMKQSEVCFDEGQANKSARGMPWHQEPMKDVTSCEKLRGAANK